MVSHSVWDLTDCMTEPSVQLTFADYGKQLKKKAKVKTPVITE